MAFNCSVPARIAVLKAQAVSFVSDEFWRVINSRHSYPAQRSILSLSQQLKFILFGNDVIKNIC
jgi:hypothetical protein